MQLLSVEAEFTGREVFALATTCVIGVVVWETQEAQVIGPAVRGITVDVSELSLFFTDIPPKPEAKRASPPRHQENFGLCVFSRILAQVGNSSLYV